MTKSAVFISSSAEWIGIARELARQLRSFAEVTMWSEGTLHVGKAAAESLTEAADRSDFAMFVFTAYDRVRISSR